MSAPPARAELLVAAIRVLLDNWRGSSTVPSAALYPHQWSWDSAFIALGLSRVAPRRAATELLTLFGAQWADGRIPHIAFRPAVPDEAYFPGPSFWRSDDQPGHPPIATSGLIQPPVHAIAAVAVADRLGSAGDAFVRRAYPALVEQNAYLRQRRVVGPGGLAAVAHPWETGLDNSPAWDAALHAVPADLALFDTYTRRDLAHAGAGERPTDEDYARYIRLALVYRDSGYDDDWLRAEAEFCVVDPALNALWGWSELVLADLAERIGEDPVPHRAEAARITASLVAHLWSPTAGAFLAYDRRTRVLRPELSVAGLIPLVLPGLPEAVVEALVGTLTGPAFGAGSDDVCGVPSFDRTDARYDPRRYWRGPVWVNTTWLVIRGLRQHGRTGLANRLSADLIQLVAGAGFREYFHPETGTGHGTASFGWTAALLVEELAGADG